MSVDEIKQVCKKSTKPKKKSTSKKLLPLFGQSECDETTRARMIKSGLSDKTIEEQCGKIGEKVESKDTVEEEKVTESA